MRQTIVAGLLAIMVSFALPATAQQGVPTPAPAEGGIFGLSTEQVVAIAIGGIAGALVLHALVPADLTYFAGGVLGGLLANWWYGSGGGDRLSATRDAEWAARKGFDPDHVLQIRATR